MPEGKYFFIRNQLSGLVVDIENRKCEAGHEIVLSEKRDEGNDTQIWYEEQFTGTIRSKLFDLCLTISEGNVLTVAEFKEGDSASQEWVVAKDKLQSKNDANRVIELKDENCEPEARCRQATLVVAAKHQLWDIEYMDAIYFYIVNEVNEKVVSVLEGDREADAKVIVEEKREGADCQLWYEGKLGHVRSKMNNFVMETKSDEVGASTRLMPFEPGNPKQLWTQYGPKLVSMIYPKFVLAFKKRKMHNGAKLVINHDENLPHQRWRLEELW